MVVVVVDVDVVVVVDDVVQQMLVAISLQFCPEGLFFLSTRLLDTSWPELVYFTHALNKGLILMFVCFNN